MKTKSFPVPNRLFALAAKLKTNVPLPLAASKKDAENPDLGPFNEVPTGADKGVLVLQESNRRMPGT